MTREEIKAVLLSGVDQDFEATVDQLLALFLPLVEENRKLRELLEKSK